MRRAGGRGQISDKYCIAIEKNCLYEYDNNDWEEMLKDMKNESRMIIAKDKA